MCNIIEDFLCDEPFEKHGRTAMLHTGRTYKRACAHYTMQALLVDCAAIPTNCAYRRTRWPTVLHMSAMPPLECYESEVRREETLMSVRNSLAVAQVVQRVGRYWLVFRCELFHKP